MNPFLKQVASSLFEQYGNRIDQLSVVFPNRRSGVFFNAYLKELATQSILGPEVITINEFVSQHTEMQISDQIGLILHLHQIYCTETGHPENLDEFFFWGEILLNDFNDVDKYLLDADDLFQNISDLKEIENQFDYLTENQKQAIERFWGNLGKAGESVNREKFLKIWNKLAIIYHRFRGELIEQKAGYSGLVYRDLVEKLQNDESIEFLSNQYIFVGFNALNACENKLFRLLKARKNAQFFWDYDESFVNDTDNEAGLFMRRNLVEFPMPSEFSVNEQNTSEKEINIVSVPGQVAQSQIINHDAFLNKAEEKLNFDDTALILADENLLVPIVSAAGCKYDPINITMGYPLKNTPVYSLITQLIELQKNYRKLDGKPAIYHRPVLALLNHQLIINPETRKKVSEIIEQNKIYVRTSDLACESLPKQLFTKQESWSDFANYLMEITRELAIQFSKDEESPKLENEYLFQVYTSLQRLTDTLNQYTTETISLSLFYRILTQHLQRVSIPFEGEPLSGLQVMGVLETRNLDFKNLVLFSANEDKLPKTSAVHSFIPYNLRKAFGLPAYEEQDAMFAYYFYRLLNRAKHITLVYDSSSDGLNTGEMSRYIYQLLYDSKLSPKFYHLDFDFKSSESHPISIQGTKQHQQTLLSHYSERRLSPSALNTYLDCKLKFYFRHIARLKETDEVLEDVDPRLFGNLFHFAVELLYTDLVGKTVSRENLESLAANKNKLWKVIHAAFGREYYKDKSLKDVKITGKNILIAENLLTYIEKMLEEDIRFTPFKILDLEGDFEADFSIQTEDAEHTIKLGGIIDRLDKTSAGTRIIDYKTGQSLVLKFRDYTEFYDRKRHNRPKEILQTLVYSEIYRKSKNAPSIYPTIYKIDDFFNSEFAPQVLKNGSILEYNSIHESFTESLNELLQEIFSSSNVYDQTEEKRKCEHCPYNLICRR